jgi:hypothetical protein
MGRHAELKILVQHRDLLETFEGVSSNDDTAISVTTSFKHGPRRKGIALER